MPGNNEEAHEMADMGGDDNQNKDTGPKTGDQNSGQGNSSQQQDKGAGKDGNAPKPEQQANTSVPRDPPSSSDQNQGQQAAGSSGNNGSQAAQRNPAQKPDQHVVDIDPGPDPKFRVENSDPHGSNASSSSQPQSTLRQRQGGQTTQSEPAGYSTAFQANPGTQSAAAHNQGSPPTNSAPAQAQSHPAGTISYAHGDKYVNGFPALADTPPNKPIASMNANEYDDHKRQQELQQYNHGKDFEAYENDKNRKAEAKRQQGVNRITKLGIAGVLGAATLGAGSSMYNTHRTEQGRIASDLAADRRMNSSLAAMKPVTTTVTETHTVPFAGLTVPPAQASSSSMFHDPRSSSVRLGERANTNQNAMPTPINVHFVDTAGGLHPQTHTTPPAAPSPYRIGPTPTLMKKR